ncbi:MAG: prephenate dehydratase [Bacteroidales bacterium]|jgi:prephenate dehydratase|nr:prephenate dehydratase [Bacteroidales bacterium]
MKVSIQGVTGCFHEVAAKQYFNGENIEAVPCSSFELTLNAALDGSVNYAVIAIENARSGSILQNYTLIRESGMKILGELNLRIIQNLMALPGHTIDTIHTVQSHPIALAQCMNYLKQHAEWTLIESEDTALSAKEIRDKNLLGTAAIASKEAADIYGLEIIAPSIETYRQNYTRFLVVGRQQQVTSRGNKISICFSTRHMPGALSKVLAKLADRYINLSKIQSVPKFNEEWEYMFYCDLETHREISSEVIHRILREDTRDLEILGIYQKGDMLL